MTTKPASASRRATDQRGAKSKFSVEEATPWTSTIAGVAPSGSPTVYRLPYSVLATASPGLVTLKQTVSTWTPVEAGAAWPAGARMAASALTSSSANRRRAQDDTGHLRSSDRVSCDTRGEAIRNGQSGGI